MAPILQRPGGTGTIDLGARELEAGLIRLAVLGSDGFELVFDDPDVIAAASGCLLEPAAAPGTEPADVADPEADAEAPGPFDPALLQPYAARGLAALEAAAPGDERLRRLLELWRPRALALAGRAGELSGEERLRGRLEQRLESIRAALEEARAAGDDDRAQALHARYIELGTTYAGRLARTW